MSDDGKRKIGGGKLARSETVTVRLDPQLRYLIELAARRQRRTVSSFIEWALEDSLSSVVIGESYEQPVTLAEQKHNLWDTDEADRFIKLAMNYPEMLNHHEQILWKLIRENGYLWKGNYQTKLPYEWKWDVCEKSLLLDKLRSHWKIFNYVASGKEDKNTLPQWTKIDPDPIPF